MESARPQLHAAGFFPVLISIMVECDTQAGIDRRYRLNACGALWQDAGRNRISPQMLKLVIGNKNYSSWSMRPWLALRANDIPFEEVFIPLYTDDKADKDRILSFSRAGKVPALIDGDVTVWDSLAIIEYLAEKFPQSRLWPEDAARRARVRPLRVRGNALGVHQPAHRVAVQCPRAQPPSADDAEPRSGRRSHRRDLDRLPPAVR
jgi:glutathione S-transferase